MDLRSWLSTAKGTTTPGNQGQSAKALADLTKDRIRSAANAFFTKLVKKTRRTRPGTILRTKMRRVRTGGRVTKTMRGRS